MTNIIAALDAWMEANYGSYIHTYFGFCELARKTYKDAPDQPVPMTITGTHKREQVSLDDKKEFITWVRVVDSFSQGNEIDGNDWDFGIRSNSVQSGTLRLVMALKVELGENLAYQIARYLPELLSASGYSLISINRPDISISADHETIYTTELGQGNYERHRFTWNLYAYDIPLQYIINPLCTSESCCDNSIVEEDNDCLVTEQ